MKPNKNQGFLVLGFVPQMSLASPLAQPLTLQGCAREVGKPQGRTGSTPYP
ncbi:hypothetical protein [Nostoc sp. 'Peltigera malacea cyanobiont' DB3992]|uniref:hypothetical protein n=1 Tax=Nostoc sp. 'Peltigera malacea cyanobiont' DB3992 TaxID=1206980 RepID=UPI0015D493C6|nr:hypothetical protein [Nostoc sp. 'Peltigera malacea cyanobiont' DB3992]